MIIMIDYKDLIDESPFILNHLITLKKTHDYFINYYIENETEISPSQYYMLMFLFYNGNTNQSDIAKACLMNRSGVSRAFKEFEQKGLLTRVEDPENKRAYKITLTEKGKKTAKFLESKELEWEEIVCNDSNIDKDDLMEKLQKLSYSSLNLNREKLVGKK